MSLWFWFILVSSEHKPRAAGVVCLYPYWTKNGDNENCPKNARIQPAVIHEDFFEKWSDLEDIYTEESQASGEQSFKEEENKTYIGREAQQAKSWKN